MKWTPLSGRSCSNPSPTLFPYRCEILRAVVSEHVTSRPEARRRRDRDLKLPLMHLIVRVELARFRELADVAGVQHERRAAAASRSAGR